MKPLRNTSQRHSFYYQQSLFTDWGLTRLFNPFQHVRFTVSHEVIVINVPFCPEDTEKGATACWTPVFSHGPLYGKVVDIIARVGFSLCAQSMHRVQGLCTLPHVPPLCSHSSHCSAATCAQSDVMGPGCLWRSHLTCFIFVQAAVTRKGSRGKRIFSCLKGRWQRSTTGPAFTRAIFGITWDQEVRSLTGQFRPDRY